MDEPQMQSFIFKTRFCLYTVIIFAMDLVDKNNHNCLQFILFHKQINNLYITSTAYLKLQCVILARLDRIMTVFKQVSQTGPV